MGLRASLVLACATVLPGCVDMLGLGGLTYDQGLAEDGVVADHASGGAGIEGGSGGLSGGTGGGIFGLGGTPYQDNDFTGSFPRDSLIASSPESPERYWIYSAEEATLKSYEFRPDDDDFVGAQDWPVDANFTHLIVVPYDGGETLIGYDSVGATVSQVTDADGVGSLRRLKDDVGTHGRTAFLPVFTGTEWLALSYSATDGNYRYSRPLPAEKAETFGGTWEPGWTSVVRFVFDGEEGVLKHNSDSGALQFDRFVGLGLPYETVLDANLGFSATRIASFTDNGQWRVLTYLYGQGEVATGTLAMTEVGGTFLQRETGYFRADLTEIVPLSLARGPVAITFASPSGRPAVRHLSPLETLGGPVVR